MYSLTRLDCIVLPSLYALIFCGVKLLQILAFGDFHIFSIHGQPCFAIVPEPNLIFAGVKFCRWMKSYEYHESLFV